MPHLARRRRRAAVLLLLLTLLAGAGLIGGLRWVEAMLEPVRPGTDQVSIVEIPPGASTREIGELLYSRNLIWDPILFRYYARYVGLDGQLKSGEFRLSAAMSLPQILDQLTRSVAATFRFTVREGLTVAETAAALAAEGHVELERFMQVAAQTDLAVGYLPPEAGVEHRLEGYLFPDTYEAYRGATEEEILALLFARFERVWTPERRARAQELGLSIHEVMTLASIIEKEAQVAAERRIISGVFHNRLAIGMKLDADPTVRYAIKKPYQEIVLYVDLEADSPYNTYKYAGLPPGPIAAPGEASIDAALWPDAHDFWYFVAKADGSGGHYFATSLEEQTANIERARANERR